MKRKTLPKKLVTLAMVFTTVLTFMGCANTKPDAEQIVDITSAVQNADSELFYKSMEESEIFDSYFEAVKNNSTTGLGAVYVKMNEKIKDVTVEPDKENETYDIPVSVSSYDAYTLALDKMYEAAIEGEEAVADMPTWLCAALDEAEMTTESIEFNSRTDSATLKYQFFGNEEFYKGITCGMYDFMNSTVTTCTGDGSTSILIAKDDEVLFSVDFYSTPLEMDGISEEEINSYIEELSKEYEAYEGVRYYANYKEGELKEFIMINYDTVSASDLVDLGFLTDSNVDMISLKKTIDIMEEQGVTCVTENFGITSSEEETE